MKKGLLAVAASLMVSVPAFAGQESLTPEEIYQPALNNYMEAIKLSLSGANKYALRICDVDEYWLMMILPYGSGTDMEYAFYDMDQNGIPELFLGGGDELTDVFGYDGNKVVRLAESPGRGYRTLYQNGVIESYSHGGASTYQYRFYRMSANGYALDELDYLERSGNQYSRNGINITEAAFQQIIDDYQKAPKMQLSWKALSNAANTAADSRPTVPYYNILFDPLLYGGQYDGQWNIEFNGKVSDVVDHGDYYEFKDKQLNNYQVFDTEAEAKNSPDYEAWQTIEKWSDGKYRIRYETPDYVAVNVYSGSLYVNKNAIVSDERGVSEGDVPKAVYRMDEFLAYLQQAEYGAFHGHITFIDEKGYASFITLYNH